MKSLLHETSFHLVLLLTIELKQFVSFNSRLLTHHTSQLFLFCPFQSWKGFFSALMAKFEPKSKIMDNKERPADKNENQENQNPTYNEGSKSDPQMTELEGLKKGGKEPNVHNDDKPRDSEGKRDA